MSGPVALSLEQQSDHAFAAVLMAQLARFDAFTAMAPQATLADAGM